jgi:2-keto-4-pentenoate hydratase/2-oxohepta-3-ene-1,7-dioic acid hydratase in catechol pathway
MGKRKKRLPVESKGRIREEPEEEMRIVRFQYGSETGYGLLEEEEIAEIGSPFVGGEEFLKTGRRFPRAGVRILAPCTPSKVLCIGLNYRGHAQELKLPLPDKPVLFMKPSTAVIGPEETIIFPPASRRVDYEAELGVVIRRPAKNVPQEKALDYVLGYTCANDVTARDLQSPTGQWTYAKGFDTFCPLGPWIETEVDDPEKLQVKGYLNGKLVQSASTAEHIFPVAELIAFISACMTLLPGDVIITGTPSGIGPLQPGDRFTVEIEAIGRLSNPCAGEG